jgi:hypothetical protein
MVFQLAKHEIEIVQKAYNREAFGIVELNVSIFSTGFNLDDEVVRFGGKKA